ncbi:uncharacterized membrane protein HdeD (DUF308 family) [Aliiruegeria haliotis]|uniref:Uncharacterized membrane protein HdeD (DUF308 family) n=1 Tax=Aliiruegeria haliotis TaxID=1280846 RepID=A0A2T0RI95_9RHOB|nr:DUF308 domain-containing protein [Aliiruegeria haliotis]PRY20878.1 uncharacterized membrane protein HdeD (DUF308 family) [Aliiruegeria haliotis]
MSEWARWMMIGLLSVLFGILALGNAVAVSLAIAVVTGSLLILAGGIQAVVGLTDDTPLNKFLSVMIGLLVVILGVSFVRNPFEGTLSLTLVVTLFIGSAGILRLFWAFRMRETGFFWMMLLSGALSILLAGYIFANFAEASTKLLGILLGLELLFNGLALVVLGLFLRAYSDDI